MHHKTEEAVPAPKTVRTKLDRHKVYKPAEPAKLVRINQRQSLRGNLKKLFSPVGNDPEFTATTDVVTLSSNEYITTNLLFGTPV